MHSNHSRRTFDVEAVVKEFISLSSSRKDDLGASCEQTVHEDDCNALSMCRADFQIT